MLIKKQVEKNYLYKSKNSHWHPIDVSFPADNTKKNRKFKLFAKEDTETINNACTSQQVNIGNYCKVTCNNCADISVASSIYIDPIPECDDEDNDKVRFFVGRSSDKNKGCRWLRNQGDPAKITELCEVGKAAYFNCKELVRDVTLRHVLIVTT